MASEQILQAFDKEINELRAVNEEKLLRTSLGEESMKEALAPFLDELNSKIDFAKAYAPKIHDKYITQFTNSIKAIKDQLIAQANRNSQEYIANKQTVVDNCKAQLEQMRANWAHFVTVAVEERGFLHDEGIKQAYERTVSNMKNEADVVLNNIKKESNAVIGEAKKLAGAIETRARKTAAKISVEDAQKQFADAQKPLLIQVIIWGVLSVLAIFAFFVLLYIFLHVELPEKYSWQIIYFTAIRITGLAAVGSVAAYCMKILKAQLHMFQHNMHRRRVTNSIEAFVESAITPEQRDLILAHLVDAVATFGNSGLLESDQENIYAPKMTIDNVTRSISSGAKDS